MRSIARARRPWTAVKRLGIDFAAWRKRRRCRPAGSLHRCAQTRPAEPRASAGRRTRCKAAVSACDVSGRPMAAPSWSASSASMRMVFSTASAAAAPFLRAAAANGAGCRCKISLRVVTSSMRRRGAGTALAARRPLTRLAFNERRQPRSASGRRRSSSLTRGAPAERSARRRYAPRGRELRDAVAIAATDLHILSAGIVFQRRLRATAGRPGSMHERRCQRTDSIRWLVWRPIARLRRHPWRRRYPATDASRGGDDRWRRPA